MKHDITKFFFLMNETISCEDLRLVVKQYEKSRKSELSKIEKQHNHQSSTLLWLFLELHMGSSLSEYVYKNRIKKNRFFFFLKFPYHMNWYELKQQELLNIFELFFQTLWQAFLNTCLCFGYTDICQLRWPKFKTVRQRL